MSEEIEMKVVTCSFCNKPSSEVGKMVTGFKTPGVSICNECIAVSLKAMAGVIYSEGKRKEKVESGGWDDEPL